MKTKRMVLKARIAEVVLCHFAERGQPATIREVAEAAGVSPSTVRRVLEKGDPRFGYAKAVIEVRDKSYGGVIGERLVDGVVPSLKWVCTELAKPHLPRRRRG